MEKEELLALLRIHLKGLSEHFDDTALEEGLSSAIRELGWKLPVTKDFRVYWILERAKRACVSAMCLDTAYAFKFKQINLQHRFEHFHAMIKEMDNQFALAKKEHPDEFLPDMEDMDTAEKLSSFGDYHGAGFHYDITGRPR